MAFPTCEPWTRPRRFRVVRSKSEDRPVFKPGAPLRPLGVVVSDEILTAAKDNDKAEYLIGLLHDPNIKLDYYSDDGPPPEAESISVSTRMIAYRGWLTLTPDQSAVIGATENSTYKSALVLGNVLEVLEGLELPSSYLKLGDKAGRKKRRKDVLAGLAAEAAGADLMVCRRPILLDPPFRFTDGLVAADIDNALSLVGLFLRQQGQFIVDRSIDGNITFRQNKGLFYWVAARELLPAGWRWFSACVKHDVGTGQDRLTYLGGALHSRIQKVLQDRDRLNAMLIVPHNNDTADEALSALDSIVINIMAAYDVAAAVAGITLGTSLPRYAIAWQRYQFRQEIRRLVPDLYDLIKPDSEGSHLLTIVRKIRNSVHGEGLQPLAVSSSSERKGTLVGLPRDDASLILEAAEAFGGRDSWGLQEILPGSIHADPMVFVERLIPVATTLLNSLLLRTPVENLEYVNLSDEDLRPPDEVDSPFNKLTRLHIRWQLGF